MDFFGTALFGSAPGVRTRAPGFIEGVVSDLLQPVLGAFVRGFDRRPQLGRPRSHELPELVEAVDHHHTILERQRCEGVDLGLVQSRQGRVRTERQRLGDRIRLGAHIGRRLHLGGFDRRLEDLGLRGRRRSGSRDAR